jgi:16S rRNA (guanine527-N7)-methyltransferase
VSQDREPLPSRVEGLPPLPPEALAVLAQGLSTLRLDDLPEPAVAGMVDQLRLLLAWNQSINLSAIRDAEAAVREHILDSLTAVQPLRERGLEALLDLGSGGGYPGLPLALALPARRALLVESVGKKAAFLSAAAGLLATDPRLRAGEIEVFDGRAELLAADGRHRERWPAVVARAIAALAELAEIALPDRKSVV